MTRTLQLLILLGCMFGSSLLFAQSEAWEVKKNRTQEIQKPSFKYRTRSGAKSKSARQFRTVPNLKGSRPSLNLQIKGRRWQEPPREIKGELPTTNNQAARIATDFPSAANHYLSEVSELMQISAPNEEFIPKQQWKDILNNQHLRLQQQYQGIDVYGSEIIVHANQRAVQGLNGRYMPTPHSLNTVPSISDTDAIQTALGQLEAVSYLNETQKKLLQYTGPEAKLVILPNWETGTPQLAWQVMARPNMLDYWEIMIDAQSGALIQKTNLTCSIAPEMHLSHGDAHAHHHHSHSPKETQSASPLRLTNASQGSGVDLNNINQTLNVWQASDGFGLIDASKDIFKSPAGTSISDLEGVLITYDALSKPKPESVSISFSETNVFADPAAVSAHVNASIAYDYFRQKHNRLAIDGEGGNILSVVNYVEDDSSGMDNAFWNGTFMVYGNGDVAFRPLAGSLDVGGHEMTHGVINATANLVYRDQSGAINEHIADVFGVLIENEDFLLGEDVVNTRVFPSGALRDMESPHNGGTSLRDNGWQPDNMSEIYTGEEDNGGVHINSGIPNRAFFLIASEIGRDRAGELYYHALTTYLTASSEFSDLRLALLNSADSLFGTTESQAVAAAFDAVGITEEVGNDNPGNGGGDDDGDELPTIAGNEFLLTVNTDERDRDEFGNINSLYIVDLASGSFQAISTTTVNRKPTITDDGSAAFFITEDETIQGIDLSPPFNEQVISNESLWSNLSISKDGKRLAIVSNQQQPEIWVADLTRDTDNFMRFELFNPTTQDGVTTGEVQYADAIEWDYSGEFLIYDAFNQVQGFGFGETIEYWDVGAIRVWDNTADDFGDGSIQKIFTNLPRGTNIGNPSFSKTNRNIVCFDLFDAEDETYQIIATDLSTGETNVVYNNNTLGFPSYSSDDSFMVFDVIDEDGNPAVGRITLNEDKTSSDGELETPYIFAKWTTWFSQGERIINSSEKDILSYEMLLEAGNVAGTISNDSIKLVLPEDTDPSTLVARFTASPSSEVFVGEFQQISGISSNDFSQEVDYTVVAQDGSTRTYVVAAEVEQTEDPVTSLGDPLSEKAVVYPNPFEQEIYLPEPLTGNYQLRLSDVLGRSYNLAVNQAQVQVKELLAPGIYFLTIQTPKRTQTIRLLRK